MSSKQTKLESQLATLGLAVNAKFGFTNGDQFVLTYLYYVKIETFTKGTIYKVGITDSGVRQRFSRENEILNVETLARWAFDDRELAKRAESAVLKAFSHYKIQRPLEPKVRILCSGNNELFSQDIRTGHGFLHGGEEWPPPKLQGEPTLRLIIEIRGGKLIE